MTFHSRAANAAPLVIAMLLILAACKGGAINGNSLPATAISPGAPVWGASEKASPQLLYVPSEAIPPGGIFELKLSGTRLRTIKKGISYPQKVAIDGSGTLYVLNFKVLLSVTEYALGTTKLLRTVTRGISTESIGMGVDEAGNLWVLDFSGPLVRYKAGNVDPEFATYSGLCAGGIDSFTGPQVLTVDTFGTAYVGVNCGTYSGPVHALVREYDSSHKVARTIAIPSNESPETIGTDSSGRLYLLFSDSSDKGRVGIAEYSRGATKPLLTFYVTPALYNRSGFFAFDSSNNVYFSTGECIGTGSGPLSCNSFISQYQNDTSQLLRTVKAPSQVLFGGVAIDRRNNIYVNAFPIRDKKSTRIDIYPSKNKHGKVFASGQRLGFPLIYP
jgi:hypothetical protein